ncbi:MAG: hypothetical protein ACTSRG_19610 [Candidatus Helarchaeota archaeon]
MNKKVKILAFSIMTTLLLISSSFIAIYYAGQVSAPLLNASSGNNDEIQDLEIIVNGRPNSSTMMDSDYAKLISELFVQLISNSSLNTTNDDVFSDFEQFNENDTENLIQAYLNQYISP